MLFIDIIIKGTGLACPAPMLAKYHNVQEALHVAPACELTHKTTVPPQQMEMMRQ